jgi:5-methylcytosine-specific restriction endonuclease McrA
MDAYKKHKIPKAIREQLWIQKVGKKFETKCKTTWCRNKITVFDFQAGHDVPESKGGSTELSNLIPICGRCNLSMGNQFTFKDWCKAGKNPSKWKTFFQHLLGQDKCIDTTENGSKSPRKPTNRNGKPSK